MMTWLPNSIDLLTISFGLRNATQLSAALDEIHRVLKPGGRFICLEFSRPQWWHDSRLPSSIWSNRSAAFPTNAHSSP